MYVGEKQQRRNMVQYRKKGSERSWKSERKTNKKQYMTSIQEKEIEKE